MFWRVRFIADICARCSILQNGLIVAIRRASAPNRYWGRRSRSAERDEAPFRCNHAEVRFRKVNVFETEAISSFGKRVRQQYLQRNGAAFYATPCKIRPNSGLLRLTSIGDRPEELHTMHLGRSPKRQSSGQYFSTAFGRLLENSWNIIGRFLGGSWDMFGRLLKAVW